MSASPKKGYSLKVEIAETSCIYFCSHFYTGFKDRTEIKNASILKNHTMKEALCYCLTVWKELKCLRKYNTLSDEFFFETRKLLIQHYPKVYAKNNLVIRMTPSD